MVPVMALIDSGMENNFVDAELVKQMGIPTDSLENPLEAHALNGLKLFTVLKKTVNFGIIFAYFCFWDCRTVGEIFGVSIAQLDCHQTFLGSGVTTIFPLEKWILKQ